MKKGAVSARMVFAIAGIVACLDQLTKYIIRTNMDFGSVRPVIDGFFNLTLIRNDGAVFGMMRGNNTFFIVLTIIVIGIIVALRGRYRTRSSVIKLGIGLILGGAIGNLIDRVHQPYAVIDFLDFYIGPYHWPVFNIADSSICIGVALLILFSMRKKAV